jgi:hypothetical protein
MNEATGIAHLIQAAIAPVFLLTGVASMLGVLTNRLARIVDRARVLEAQLGAQPQVPPKLLDDLRILDRRASYINVAISLCTLAALMVALVVVTLFGDAFIGVSLDKAIALLFVGAMLCLSTAFIVFFVEVRLATLSLRIGHPHI